jgi:transposase
VAGSLATWATGRVQAIPRVGPVLGAVFVAEIGDVTRLPGWRRMLGSGAQQ